MAASRNRYLVRSEAEGWDVLREGHARPTAHLRRKGDAVRRARDLTSRAGGGEVVVLGRSGKIAESSVVPRPRRAA